MQAGAPPPSVARQTTLLRELLEVTAEFQRALGEELGVNSTDRTAMEHLIQAERLTASELSRRLKISSAATTTVIDRLVQLGHAHREPHPTDRRSVIVVPSPHSAERALGRLFPMIRDIDQVGESFTDAELESIVRYLERVVEVYRSHSGTGQAPETMTN